jgi:hypothetical protein
MVEKESSEKQAAPKAIAMGKVEQPLTSMMVYGLRYCYVPRGQFNIPHVHSTKGRRSKKERRKGLYSWGSCYEPKQLNPAMFAPVVIKMSKP